MEQTENDVILGYWWNSTECNEVELTPTSYANQFGNDPHCGAKFVQGSELLCL